MQSIYLRPTNGRFCAIHYKLWIVLMHISIRFIINELKIKTLIYECLISNGYKKCKILHNIYYNILLYYFSVIYH